MIQKKRRDHYENDTWHTRKMKITNRGQANDKVK